MDGYIYCISNPIFINNIYKVGMTEKKDPIYRIKELYSTNIPLPYKLEFAKKVKNVREVEQTIHTILEKYGHRLNLKREFFNIELIRIKNLFDFFEGDYYIVDQAIIENTDIIEQDIIEQNCIIICDNYT